MALLTDIHHVPKTAKYKSQYVLRILAEQDIIVTTLSSTDFCTPSTNLKNIHKVA